MTDDVSDGETTSRSTGGVPRILDLGRLEAVPGEDVWDAYRRAVDARLRRSLDVYAEPRGHAEVEPCRGPVVKPRG